MKHEFNLSEAIDVINEVLASGGEFQMYPKGTSMLPLIVQGRDAVTLTRTPEENLKKYDIIFYRRTNGQFVLHRIIKVCKDGTFVLCGDNQLQYETGIRHDQVIGVVKQIKRRENNWACQGLRNSFYVFWHCIAPMRHVTWFLRHGVAKMCRIFAIRKKKTS